MLNRLPDFFEPTLRPYRSSLGFGDSRSTLSGMEGKTTIPHLVSLQDLSVREVDDLLDLSMRIKRRASGVQLTGKSVGLLFFRGSLRTRTSFEAWQLRKYLE